MMTVDRLTEALFDRTAARLRVLQRRAGIRDALDRRRLRQRVRFAIWKSWDRRVMPAQFVARHADAIAREMLAGA